MQQEQQTSGDSDAPATLFLLCDTVSARDAGWMAALLGPLGMLPPFADLQVPQWPMRVEAGVARMHLSGGADAAAALAALGASQPANYVGMDSAPDAGTRAVLALSFDRLSPSLRAATAQRLAFTIATIANRTGGFALYWPPARLWSPAGELAQAVITLEKMGIPPILHFVAFESGAAAGGAPQRLRTRGLRWFVGQELIVAGPPYLSVADLTRHAARVAIDMMVHGRITTAVEAEGLGPGERVQIRPATDTDDDAMVEVTIVAPDAGHP